MKLEINERMEAQDQPFTNFASYHQAYSNRNSRQQQCTICFNQIPIVNMCSLVLCQHYFCEACLLSYVELQLNQNLRVFCPKQSCGKQLNESMPFINKLTPNQRINLTKINTYYKILTRPQLKHCQKTDCLGVINIKQQKPLCSVCEAQHCALCHHLSHLGECEVKIAIGLQMSQKYRQCSQCGQIIQKTEGCTHMTCTCGHYFCYCCGQTLDGQHICKTPDNMTILHKIRWQIEHEQLWYEGNRINFLRYLNCVSPPKQMSPQLRIFWVLLYTIIFYPLTIMLSLAAVATVIAIILALMIIFSASIPFFGICSDSGLHLFPTETIRQQNGCWCAFTVVIILYPVLYLINLVQFLYRAVVIQEIPTDLSQGIMQFAIGIRNMIMIPCLMLIDNESFYLEEAKNRDRRQGKAQILNYELIV